MNTQPTTCTVNTSPFCHSSYLIPVILCACVLNVPKYFETRYYQRPVPSKADPNATVLAFGVSDLRNDPLYIRFYINWTRLVTTGILPMAALIFFNWNIFR